MTVNTKGSVATAFKDVLLVCSLVETALNRLIRAERKILFPGVAGRGDSAREQFADVSVALAPSLGMAQFSFKFRAASRCLSLFFTCDADNADLASKSLSLSMGCHGDADLFVKTALHALSLLGPAYFVHNDCDSDSRVPLSEPRPNLLQAISWGYLTPFQAREWLHAYQGSPALRAAQGYDALKFFGVPLEVLEEAVATQGYSEITDKVRALGATVRPCHPQFLLDYYEETATM